MGTTLFGRLRSRMLRRLTRTAAAAEFAVSVSYAVKLVQCFRQAGSVAPPPRGRKPFVLAEHEALVRELVAARPDLTPDELTLEA